jgi:thiamine-phosphate diphosphorylase
MIDAAVLRLVAITDNLRDGVAGLASRAAAAQRGGATMIQVRLPNEAARTVVEATRALVAAVDVPVLVHNRVDVALAGGAAGVHLGVQDIEVADVRAMVGDRFIVGRSASSEVEARRGAGADFLAIGPVFAAARTGDEPAIGVEVLAQLVRVLGTPVVAIGGINAGCAAEAVRAGAAGVALIRGIFGAPDPEGASRQVRAAIGM